MGLIKLSPTGKLSTGHVLDVSKGPFERALKDYDSLLYVAWNADKLKGWGCWEIKRRPALKSVVYRETFEGNTYSVLDYDENPLINHVLDCAFLNYDQLRKIKEMDIWVNGNPAHFVDNLESRERSHVENENRKNREELRYMGKQIRNEMKDFKDMIAGGLNPAELANHWDK